MPELGIFMSSSEKPTAAVWMESKVLNRALENDREYDDGVLWFREVAPAGMNVFNHLVGNVADMTLENGHLYTIGGSALSPPTRPIDQDLEIPNWKAGNKGYSDVGFRLAFSGPANAKQQLMAVLEKQAYLALGEEGHAILLNQASGVLNILSGQSMLHGFNGLCVLFIPVAGTTV